MRIAGPSEFLLASCLALVVSTSSMMANAEDAGATESADQTFAAGVQLMDAGRYEDALPHLQKSQRLAPCAATLVNIATCYARLGRTATAWRTYQKAIEAAILEKNDKLRALAEQAGASLAPTLTRLRVVSAAGTEGIAIKVNGELVDSRAQVPLDPGENYIEASAPGRSAWRHIVNAHGQGALIVVEVPDLRPSEDHKSTAARAPAGAEAQARPRPASPTGHQTDYRPLAGISFGLGATALAIGTVSAFRAKAAYDDSRDHCIDNHCNPTGFELRETAGDRASVATWTFGVGLLAVTAGTALWLFSPHSREAPALSAPPNLSRHDSARSPRTATRSSAPAWSLIPWIPITPQPSSHRWFGLSLEGRL